MWYKFTFKIFLFFLHDHSNRSSHSNRMLRDCEMLNWKLYQAQRSSPQTCRHKYENTTEARWIAAERFYEWKLWCICEHSMERRERNPTSQSWGSKPHRMWKIDEREFTQSGALAELLRLYASRERLSTIFSTFSWMNLEIQTLLTPRDSSPKAWWRH